MDELFYILAYGGIMQIVWFCTPFVVLYLFMRVRRLERALQEGNFRSSPSVAMKNAAVSESIVATKNEPVFEREPQTGVGGKLFAWLQDDWLLKIGGLLLLIGCGWLVSYAFVNNWIGPMGRIGFGIILGTAILSLGTWRLRSMLHQGGVFIIIGSTTILMTVFAARQIYGFFTPTTALGVMFLSCAYVALVSVKHNYRALSIASVILAGIAPLLTNSPDANYVALFAYLLVVVLGSVWIVSVTDHREVTTTALILVAVYSVPHLFSSSPATTLLFFAYVFAAIFFVTNTMGILRQKVANIMPDTFSAAGNGLFLLAWIMTKAPEVWRSLIIAAWMVAFLVAAFAVFRITKKREPFYVYAGVGIVMLATATAAELSGAALTIALTIEVAMVSFIAYELVKDRALALRLCLLFVGPVLLSLRSIDMFGSSGLLLNRHFFVLLVLMTALMALGFYYSFDVVAHKNRSSSASRSLIVAGSLYAFILLWLSLQLVIHPSYAAVMISLFVYTLVGLVTYFVGRTKADRGLGIYGGVVLGFVVARLLLVDIWYMPLASRFVTFFVIGALLMSTAFFSRSSQSTPHKL